MKKRSSKMWFVYALGVCLLAGCIPKKIAWSPDGRLAALLSDNGFYMCDSNGVLSGPLATNVDAAAWFPDSLRLAIVRSVKHTSWAELAPLLPAERRDRVERSAKKLLDDLKAGLSAEQAATNLMAADGEAIVLWLKEAPGAREALGTNWDEVQKSEAGLETLQIATVAGGKASFGPVLARELDAIREARVSPDGKSIAYVTDTTVGTTGDAMRLGLDDTKVETMALKVVAAEGGGPAQLVDSSVAQFPDWTPDSRALVYIKAVGIVTNSDQLRLASLTRRGLTNQNGVFQWQEKPDELVALLFHDGAKARCLANGQILFSGAELRLPSRAADMPKRQQLFAWSPEGQGTVKPLIADTDRAPQDTSSFEVDPSGRRVSLVDKGQVVIIDLTTGGMENVPHATEDVSTIPVWRTAEELCYVTSPASGPAQLALWRGGQERILSADWPAAARKGLLDK